MAIAAALWSDSQVARGQSYPSRPVRLVVGLAPGGIQDITARFIGQWLSKRLGQPFVVENRVGAGTNIATEAVVRASPDGYTLLLVGPPNAINATLYEKLSFNFIRDITPIAGISREPQLLLVNPSLPVKTVGALIAYAKANPGKLNLASAGTGSAPHVSGELFKMMTGIELVHVPYRGGGPALGGLIGGQVQVMFSAISASIEHVRSGKLRALAVTTTTRSDTLSEIASVSEYVPGYEASTFIGLGAPRDTPAEIIGTLNKEINAALVDPRIKVRFADIGGAPLPGSPADFGRLIADETEKWGKVIKLAGINASQ